MYIGEAIASSYNRQKKKKETYLRAKLNVSTHNQTSRRKSPRPLPFTQVNGRQNCRKFLPSEKQTPTTKSRRTIRFMMIGKTSRSCQTAWTRTVRFKSLLFPPPHHPLIYNLPPTHPGVTIIQWEEVFCGKQSNSFLLLLLNKLSKSTCELVTSLWWRRGFFFHELIQSQIRTNFQWGPFKTYRKSFLIETNIAS